MGLWGRLLGALGRLAAPLGADEFEIRHRPGALSTVRGRLPASKAAEIRAFLDRDLDPGRPVRVRGRYGPGRSLRLEIDGPLTAEQRQRARNFLLAVLR